MAELSSIQYLLSGIEQNNCVPFLDRLTVLFAAMDKNYQEAANYYGFNCSGCTDNCCFTRFFHYTLLEYLYIKKGYDTLVHEKQVEVRRKALEVCRKTDLADEKEMPVRLMCPLNFDGLCILYSQRPMICRLHGIPYELQNPGQGVTTGPGCEAFVEQCKQKGSFKMNRTPFYGEMAELEKTLRQKVGMTQKFKFTVAQMIVSFQPY